jgi:hypothetical protein
MRVLLYPWFGSKERHYLKYAQMYKNIFGTSTTIDIVPYSIKDAVTYTGWKKQRIGCLAEPIKHTTYDCVHVMSGGSLVMFNHLNYHKSVKHRHTIFDSGPFWPDSKMAGNYFGQMTGIHLRSLSAGLYQSYLERIEGYPYHENLKQYDKWINTKRESLFLLNRNDRLLYIDKIDRLVENTNSKCVHIDAPHARLIDSNLYKESIEKYLNEEPK